MTRIPTKRHIYRSYVIVPCDCDYMGWMIRSLDEGTYRPDHHDTLAQAHESIDFLIQAKKERWETK